MGGVSIFWTVVTRLGQLGADWDGAGQTIDSSVLFAVKGVILVLPDLSPNGVAGVADVQVAMLSARVFESLFQVQKAFKFHDSLVL